MKDPHTYDTEFIDHERGLPANADLLPAKVAGVCFLGLLTFGLIAVLIRWLT